jgi:hypothetical protein
MGEFSDELRNGSFDGFITILNTTENDPATFKLKNQPDHSGWLGFGIKI